MVRIVCLLLLLVSVGCLSAGYVAALVALPIAIPFWLLPARLQPAVWLAAIPWLATLNITTATPAGFSDWQTAFYPSEALILLMAAGFWGTSRGSASKAKSARLLVGLYVGWCVVAALAGWPSVGGIRLLRPLRAAITVWVCYTVAESAGLARVSVLATSMAALTGCLGMAAYAGVLSSSSHNVAAAAGSFVDNSESLAIQLSFMLPIVLSLAMQQQSGNRRRRFVFVIWVAWLVGMGALVLSYSRSGWVGGAVGCLIVAAGALRGMFAQGKLAVLLAVIAVGCVGVALSVFQLVAGANSADYVRRLTSLTSLNVLSDRVPAWSLGIDEFQRHPIFGNVLAPNCYNLYIGIASRSGAAAVLLFMLAVVASMIHFVRSVSGSEYWLTGLGLLGGLVAFLIAGIGEFSLGTLMVPPFFSVLGLLNAGDDRPIIQPAMHTV